MKRSLVQIQPSQYEGLAIRREPFVFCAPAVDAHSLEPRRQGRGLLTEHQLIELLLLRLVQPSRPRG